MNRKLQVLFALFLLIPAAKLLAQAAPAPAANGADYDNRWDIFGGASYAHFNGVGNVLATSLVGWNGQATAWVKPIFGLSASLRGDYGKDPIPQNAYNVTSPAISQHLFLVGPEFRLMRTPKYALNFHVMLGGVYGKFDSDLNGAPPNSLGLYVNQLAFAVAVGSSFDYNLSPKLSVRVVTDFEPTHFGSAFQSEFAGAVGIVYKMGSLRRGK
jgi:hypothetical protein